MGRSSFSHIYRELFRPTRPPILLQVNLIWGSHVMDPKTGIIMNDEQDDFAIPGAADAFGLLPSPWNYPAPGKR